MRLRVLTPLLTMFAAAAVWAQTLSDPQIRATISNQMQAFQDNDTSTAFSFASPGIQRMFQSHERFGQMVQQGYPMVWRPKDIQFGELRDIAGSLWQKVFVIDQSGQTHVLDYRMVQIDGAWRISGVQVLQGLDPSA